LPPKARTIIICISNRITRQDTRNPMYVCLCNAITDRDIDQAIAAGDGTVAQVYRDLGCAPKCGKCVPVVREMLSAAGALRAGAAAA
jgi:bacterioferritin-associated ferredoxin